MAIIDKAPPRPLAPAVSPRQQVVVKLKAAPRWAGETTSLAGDVLRDVRDRFPGVAIRPYFEEIHPRAAGEMTVPPPTGRSDDDAARLRSFVVLSVPEGMDPAEFARELADRADVEIAYIEGGPTPPPVDAADDPLSGNQGYLDPAPVGIDARWTWAVATGEGVGFVDMEQGWTLNHEDLANARISIISGVNHMYHGHGTAVLGEVAAGDNTRGIVGIAPRAHVRVVSQWRTSEDYHTGEAILSAAAKMSPGDVLLLEAQTTYSTANGYLPVEVEEAVFEAIREVTRLGIIVIEAAGNGGIDFDKFEDTKGRRILNRSCCDFRDSGAIVVGAATAHAPHERLAFSNHGSRVDCYGWGEMIQTCGDGWSGTGTQTYTSDFGGTSGASPIVAGAAVLLQ